MASPADFGRKLNQFKKLVRKKHADAMMETASTVHNRVVNVTPIDTSRAKSNWIMTKDSPATGEVPFTSGARGSTLGQALMLTTENRRSVLSSYEFGDSLWIANNVHYIIRLDDGWSPQYPGGFTIDAIEAAKGVLKR